MPTKLQKLPIMYTAYGDKQKITVKFLTGAESDGMTEQSHKEQCDINNIMKRYINTGVIAHINKHEASYGIALDTDLHESMNLINHAEEIFLELPSQIRKEFGNDAAAFFTFAEDPSNHEKMVKMGLKEKPSKPINAVPTTNPPKTPETASKTPSQTPIPK